MTRPNLHSIVVSVTFYLLVLLCLNSNLPLTTNIFTMCVMCVIFVCMLFERYVRTGNNNQIIITEPSEVVVARKLCQ